jgi:hypothetical protein
MTTIERIARAMCLDALMDPANDVFYATLRADRQAVVDRDWKLFERQARAAVATMREMTPEMLDSFWESWPWHAEKQDVPEVWRDTMDEILAGKI